MLRILVPCFLLLVVSAYPEFWSRIPNGYLVRNPCNSSDWWDGVGHYAKGGGGPRNPFGLDFKAHGTVWTQQLCRLDSDGDGRTNGQELGDPHCTWRPGQTPRFYPRGHPGICEPTNSRRCMQIHQGDICNPRPSRTCTGALVGRDIRRVDLKFAPTRVPNTETNYYCQVFDLPRDRDYHITADKPLIHNHQVLHHMLLYACPDDAHLSGLKADLSTSGPAPCGMMVQEVCSHIIAGWTIGGQGDCYDGLPAATRIGATGFKRAVLEVHWNNPSLRSGIIDFPGFGVYMTTLLRQYDLGVLTIGQTGIRLRPYMDNLQVSATCTGGCTRRKLATTPIKVVSAGVHMHLTGKQGQVTLIRSNGTRETLVDERNYDYNTPRNFDHSPGVEVRGGDSLQVRCTYNTNRRRNHTYYGPATSDEMCYSYLTYYPQVKDFTLCLQYGNTPHCDGDQLLSRVSGCDVTSLDTKLWLLELECDVTGRVCWHGCQNLLHSPDRCFTGDSRRYIEYILNTDKGDSQYIRAFRSCDDNRPILRTRQTDRGYDNYLYGLNEYNRFIRTQG